MEIKLRNNTIELEDERILTNDVTFQNEYNPHNVQLWVIGNEYGALCAVWGDCEQDALDEAIDNDLLNSFLVDDEDIEPELEEDGFYAYLGNAGEHADLTNCWMEAIELNKQKIELIIKLAEARGANANNLYEV